MKLYVQGTCTFTGANFSYFKGFGRSYITVYTEATVQRMRRRTLESAESPLKRNLKLISWTENNFKSFREQLIVIVRTYIISVIIKKKLINEPNTNSFHSL